MPDHGQGRLGQKSLAVAARNIGCLLGHAAGKLETMQQDGRKEGRKEPRLVLAAQSLVSLHDVPVNTLLQT